MMPLASILLPNGGFDKWHFDHFEDHLEIIQTIKTRFLVSLAIWPLQPYTPESPGSWNRIHQEMHNDMNRALGISGTDLSQVDFDNPEDAQSFYSSNFLEHSNARQTLGI